VHAAMSVALVWGAARVAPTPAPALVEVEILTAPALPAEPPPPPLPLPPPPPVSAPAPVSQRERRVPARHASAAPSAPRPATPIAEAASAPVGPSVHPGDHPVFVAAMESSSQAGTGSGSARGGGASASGGNGSDGHGPAQVLTAADVSAMPLPRGRCSGKYTDEAKAAAIEGVIVLDLIVDADGAPRDIAVVEGLSHGLTEAAVRALAACRFTPGRRHGLAVAVQVHHFKIRFLIQDAQ
jgi:TonB family protein